MEEEPKRLADGVSSGDVGQLISENFSTTLAEMDKDSLSLKIEECLVDAAWVKPESKITDTPEVYKILNQAAGFPFLNGIYRTRLGLEQSEIIDHYESYRRLKVGFRWHVFRHSTPQDLGEKLQALKPSSVTEMVGLYYETARDMAMPAGVTVEELSQKNLEDYIEANIEGWDQSGNAAKKLRDAIARDFKNGNLGNTGFVARYNGEPASTGLLRLVNGSGYLLGGSTRPHLRGKGAYKGLVAHRIKLLKEKHIPLALVLARKDTSAPICKSLGFKIACESRCYDFVF